MKKKPIVAIIGAGPAGITAAKKLQERGCDYFLFEKDAKVGGMSKTIQLWGRNVDLGPHRFFSSDVRVNKIWLDAVDGDYHMVNRITRIFYKNKFYSYPLKAIEALSKLGVLTSVLCVLSLLKSKMTRKDLTTFEGWVINKFGRKLYSIFFKSYSEKLWGINGDELDSDFAAQRIKNFSLIEAIKTALLGNDKKHKTLVDEFAYPSKGAGHVYEKMLQTLEADKVYLNTGISSLKVSVDKIQLTDDKGFDYDADYVISTMPLTNLITLLDAPHNVIQNSNKLTFRNTILVYVKVNKTELFIDQWLYIHSNEILTGRITNFNNWDTDDVFNETILCLEYWCNDEDQIWKADEDYLGNLAAKDLETANLVEPENIVVTSVYRVPKCYPVYKRGYKHHLKVISNYFNKNHDRLIPIGRYGSFKYNNQDHSILMGDLAVKKILDDKTIDLWNLNTDYTYQEESRITETGLVTD